MEKLIEKYKAWRSDVRADRFIDFILDWDGQTQASREALKAKAAFVPVLDKRSYERFTDKAALEVLAELNERLSEIQDPVLRREIKKTKKETDQYVKLPLDYIVRSGEVFSMSYSVWVEARSKRDFSMFAPTLEKIVALVKEKTELLQTDKCKGYDYLLDLYSEGVTQSELDDFFAVLEKELLPFSNEMAAKKYDLDFSFGNKLYGKDKQKSFVQYLSRVMCFDTNRGLISESEHPFTSGFDNTDVRVTVHYVPELFESSIFSALHELGHAIFEQQTEDSLNGTFLSGCQDMALHESQSRLYENVIGRSEQFWQAHLPALKRLFPRRLEEVTPELMYKYVNRVENSCVRTDADELTYFKHIMLRYELEKEILNGLPVSELKHRWNERFEQLFGYMPTNDADGVLQDVHWAGGSFGYFPSYALGSAYSSQIFDAMNADFDVYASLEQGTTKRINDWLKQKIHRYGSSLPAKEIFESAVGGKFDPSHFINYLKNKYSRIWE